MLLSDDDFRDVSAALCDTDPGQRAAMLQTLADDPSGDPRLLALVEALLGDTTPVVVSIPLHYGELRWVAAHALAAERGAVGKCSPVILSDAVVPVNDAELVRRGASVGVPQGGGVPGALAAFAVLRDLDLLPRRPLRLESAPP